MSAAEKTRLRRELRARRRGLSVAERELAASGLVQQFRRHQLLRRGRRWAFYLPFGSELDCQPLMAEALARRKEVYLPLVRHGGNRRLVFVRLDHVQRWRRSALGMLQPQSRRFVSARRLDVVCLPLLGFDGRGGRLGQGGGYYDATFAFRRHGFARPLLFGLAFACQQVDHVPGEAWDVRLDRVITEQGVLSCATG